MAKIQAKRRIFLFSFIALILLLPSNARAEEAIQNEDCLACHDTLSHEKFTASIHGNNLCTSCHSDIKEAPHEEMPKPVQCSNCHRLESQVYLNSDHGRAVSVGDEAASCLSCHGSQDPHGILSARNPESPVYRLNIPKTCAKCHEDDNKMEKYGLLLTKPVKSYFETVHGIALEKGHIQSAVCTDCHGSHDLHAPTNPESKIYRKNVPVTCGKCHENVLSTFNRSVHGKAVIKGKNEAPVCTDCHGEHSIKSHLDPTSSVFGTAIAQKTCAQCHAAEKIITKYRLPEDSVRSFLESYHGMASKYGAATVANCSSCHGAHDILPSSDPISSVNKANLPQTCGKCHPNVGEQLAKGSVHLSPSFSKDKIIYYVSLFYILLIVLIIGGMLLHNFLDFSAKLRVHYQLKKQQSNTLRFTPNERIQHIVLMISFTVLGYTGFALKYSDAWWALPFAWLDVNYDWRGVIHRNAEIIFSGLSVYHGFYLAFTKRGREQFKAFCPVKKDFIDFYQKIRYDLGLSKTKPHFDHYNYIEKAEYWALMWGSAVMILTGGMLAFESWAMTHFPKWALDVATTVHFFEAVLATLAIIVWHFYFTIFDPDHYPMNWSMTTGRAKEEEKEKKEEKKEENPPKK